ncbi:hypothetical protein FRB94_006842 [Tulasnella sp. JGI-2019a]|nr:hypothetical protein FRB94_006842 [Tulasnella sp. JGI-2019a]
MRVWYLNKPKRCLYLRIGQKEALEVTYPACDLRPIRKAQCYGKLTEKRSKPGSGYSAIAQLNPRYLHVIESQLPWSILDLMHTIICILRGGCSTSVTVEGVEEESARDQLLKSVSGKEGDGCIVGGGSQGIHELRIVHLEDSFGDAVLVSVQRLPSLPTTVGNSPIRQISVHIDCLVAHHLNQAVSSNESTPEQERKVSTSYRES